MIVPTYVPGEWIAVVTDGTLAVLPPDTAADVVTELWDAIRSGAPLTDHLQVLLRTGITHVPPFALVNLQAGQVHALVRGQVRVEVATGTGLRALSAAHVSTWSEEVLDDVRSVAVRTGRAAVSQEARTAAEAAALPVLSAVVRVSDVLVDLVAVQAALPVDGEVEPVHLVPVPPSRPVWEPVAAAARAVRPEPEPVVPGSVVPETQPEPEPVGPEPEPVGPPADQPADQPVDPTEVDRTDRERTDAEPPAPARVPSEDHDGLTVLSSDVVALRRQLPAWTGDAVPAFAVPTPRTPPPAKLLMSSGLTVALNRPVLIGRAPQVTRVPNNEIPRLLTVASPNQDISRTHAEVRMDGEDVIVTDLRSTNGVLLLRQGAAPQRLHPGEPTVVEPGVVVDLGEGVTFIVEAGG